MERVYFIEHKGKKILIEDFTNLRAGEEYEKTLKFAQSTIAAEPQQSVLALFDASNCSFNNEMLTQMKEFTKANTPFIKKATVVGITGLLQVALSAVSKFSGREFITFKTREEALDFLASIP